MRSSSTLCLLLINAISRLTLLSSLVFLLLFLVHREPDASTHRATPP